MSKKNKKKNKIQEIIEQGAPMAGDSKGHVPSNSPLNLKFEPIMTEEQDALEWGREHYAYLLKELGEEAVTCQGIYMSGGTYLKKDGTMWSDDRAD